MYYIDFFVSLECTYVSEYSYVAVLGVELLFLCCAEYCRRFVCIRLSIVVGYVINIEMRECVCVRLCVCVYICTVQSGVANIMQISFILQRIYKIESNVYRYTNYRPTTYSA